MQLLYDITSTHAQPTAQRQQGNSQTEDIPSLVGRRILIAEDVETNQMLLRTVLAPTGAEVEIVADCAAVIESHAGKPTEVPVMALTAHARSADRKVAIEAGMKAFLAKPIVMSELYTVLRQLLPKKTLGKCLAEKSRKRACQGPLDTPHPWQAP